MMFPLFLLLHSILAQKREIPLKHHSQRHSSVKVLAGISKHLLHQRSLARKGQQGASPSFSTSELLLIKQHQETPCNKQTAHQLRTTIKCKWLITLQWHAETKYGAELDSKKRWKRKPVYTTHSEQTVTDTQTISEQTEASSQSHPALQTPWHDPP